MSQKKLLESLYDPDLTGDDIKAKAEAYAEGLLTTQKAQTQRANELYQKSEELKDTTHRHVTQLIDLFERIETALDEADE